MGMCGYYFAFNSKTVEKIKNRELDLFDFFYSGEKYDEENMLDIDKSWNALAYLLSELSDKDESLNHAVPLFDKNMFGDDPIEPVFRLGASMVAMIAEAVNKVTKEKLLENYSIVDMLEFNIYPVQEDENAEEFFEYIYVHFINMQKFLSKAASENKEIIFCIV